ncbi:SapB/AmfS family lanthipeptide [Nocardiopsis trehalosi]|jgi:hypothetical protein|nr:SapB/AmfS family lanthipeptide [Nocardiopsis trehalosi]
MTFILDLQGLETPAAEESAENAYSASYLSLLLCFTGAVEADA